MIKHLNPSRRDFLSTTAIGLGRGGPVHTHGCATRPDQE